MLTEIFSFLATHADRNIRVFYFRLHVCFLLFSMHKLFTSLSYDFGVSIVDQCGGKKDCLMRLAISVHEYLQLCTLRWSFINSPISFSLELILWILSPLIDLFTWVTMRYCAWRLLLPWFYIWHQTKFTSLNGGLIKVVPCYLSSYLISYGMLLQQLCRLLNWQIRPRVMKAPLTFSCGLGEEERWITLVMLAMLDATGDLLEEKELVLWFSMSL